MRRVLSSEQSAQVVSRYLAGEDCPTLAKAYNVCEESIRKVLIRAGIPRRPRGTKLMIGAKRDDGRGYVLIKVGAGKGAHNWRENWKLEHVIVVERKIGRKLENGEHVHHDNENRADNREGNLMVLSDSEHGKLHHGITDAQHSKIREMYAAGETVKRIHEQTGVAVSNIYKHLDGLERRHPTCRGTREVK